eukprot:1362523-Pyramimonas_sp.AAC.1
MVNLKSGVGRGADLCETLESVEGVTVIDLQKLCSTPDILRGQVLKIIHQHYRAQVTSPLEPLHPFLETRYVVLPVMPRERATSGMKSHP